jgi:HK97 family phage prohead protease
MKVEYKSVAVGGVTEVKDEGDGVITAYVSVTGVEDNVKDIIVPGAYGPTLKRRTPKGVWGHQWLTPTSKTLEAVELMPGHKDLPKELSDGTPWPEDAGALRIKMQFNLGTTRGREAYSDVQFFDNQQEWSIGYTVPENGAYKDAKGVRHIKKLDLFEFSPVLFGAMSHARTASVKDAQLGMKMLNGIGNLEIKSLEEAADLYRKDHALEAPADVDADAFEGDESSEDTSGEEAAEVDDDVDEDELDDDDYEDDDDDVEEDEEKVLIGKLANGMPVNDLRMMYKLIGDALDVLSSDEGGAKAFMELGIKALIEVKATGYDTVVAAVDAIDINLEPGDVKSMRDAAEKFDFALKSGDSDLAEESGTDLMDLLEKAMEDNPDDDLSLKTVARTIADKTSGTDEDDDEEEDDENYEESDWEDDEEDERGEASAKAKRKSLTFTSANGIEYKSGPHAGREFGSIIGGDDLSANERKRAFVGTLPNRALLALETVLEDLPGHVAEKSYVQDEIDLRTYGGILSDEEKLNMPARRGGGQHGRGGGRHRQAAEGRTPGGGRNFGETGPTKKPSAKRLKKPVKAIKKPGRGKGTVNRVAGRSKPVNRLNGAEEKRHFSADERRDAAKRGNAMPNESFPINNKTDLKNAIRLVGHAQDPEAAKLHIKKRAKALGCTDLIPESWKTVMIDMTELKTLESFVKGL